MTRRRRPQGIAALLLAAGLALGGCAAGAASGATSGTEQPATLQQGEDGGPGVVTLTEEAHDRLSVKTAPVTAPSGVLTVPYAAVVYEPDGSAWAYVESEPLTYKRERLDISSITGDTVTVSAGPAVGTQVVVQGAAELVGVETGIDGEE